MAPYFQHWPVQSEQPYATMLASCADKKSVAMKVKEATNVLKYILTILTDLRAVWWDGTILYLKYKCDELQRNCLLLLIFCNSNILHLISRFLTLVAMIHSFPFSDSRLPLELFRKLSDSRTVEDPRNFSSWAIVLKEVLNSSPSREETWNLAGMIVFSRLIVSSDHALPCATRRIISRGDID